MVYNAKGTTKNMRPSPDNYNIISTYFVHKH